MRILGVDPGETTGLVVIDADDRGWTLLLRQEIAPTEQAERGHDLWKLHSVVSEAVTEYEVEAVAMEEMLAYRQATADEKVEAQAVVKMVACRLGVPLVTYAPSTVRQTICRDGRADPQTITKTLRFLLRAPKKARRGEAWSPHQYDALAVALCHMVCIGYLIRQCKETP